jgi:hypothetical protein
MIKNVLTTAIIFGTLNLSKAQDIITKKIDGTITAKVLEVSKKEIKYKKFDNLDGPIFTIDIAEVSNIVYQNGTKDNFSPNDDSPFKVTELTNMRERGMEDAYVNYNADNCGKG